MTIQNIPCARCGKLVIAAAVGTKIRNGSVTYCSRKCAGVKPAAEVPDFFADLFKFKK